MLYIWRNFPKQLFPCPSGNTKDYEIDELPRKTIEIFLHLWYLVYMVLNVFCDGGARGNPGPAGIGVVIKNQEGKTIAGFGKEIGSTTNNVAEYTAVIEGLSYVLQNFSKNKPDRIDFFLDSKLVVSQLTGIYKIKDAKLRFLLLQVREKEAELGGNIFYRHIPRESNREADRFVNEALDR